MPNPVGGQLWGSSAVFAGALIFERSNKSRCPEHLFKDPDQSALEKDAKVFIDVSLKVYLAVLNPNLSSYRFSH